MRLEASLFDKALEEAGGSVVRAARLLGLKHQTLKYGLKPGDAVHVATALFWKVPILHTFDNKLLNKTKLMSDLSIKIEKPAWVGKLLPLIDSIEASEASNESSRQRRKRSDRNSQHRRVIHRKRR